MKKIFFLTAAVLWSVSATCQDHITSGNTKYDAADYKGAAEDYLKATQQNPKNKVAWYSLAMAYDQQWLFDEAIGYYDKAIELDPNYVDALYRRGYVKEDNGKSAEAITDYTRVLELDPGYVEAYFERGYSRVSSGKYAEAIIDYTTYIDKGGELLTDAYYERGIAKNRTADYTGAMTDLKKAGDMGKKDKNVFYEIGYSFEGQKNYEKAIEVYNKVIELDPNYYDAWHGRGICKIKTSDETGCSDLYKAEELGSPSVDLDIMDYCE